MARKPEAPPREAVPGDNIDGLPDDIMEATFHAANRRMDKFEAQREALNRAIGRFRKDLKTRGVKLKTFDAVRTLRDMEPKDVTADLAERLRYMRWLKIPVGKQADLFPKDVERDADAATAAGFRAGIAGDDPKPPPEWNGRHQDWMAGWHEGQKKLGMDMFANKDYFADDADDDGEVESQDPTAGEDGEERDALADPSKPEGNVTSLADAVAAKAAASKPPGPPAMKPEKEDPAATIKRIAQKGKKGDKTPETKAPVVDPDFADDKTGDKGTPGVGLESKPVADADDEFDTDEEDEFA